MDWLADVKVLEKMGAAPSRPSFTDGRTDFKSVVVALCTVYDMVEELLGESAWKRGGVTCDARMAAIPST